MNKQELIARAINVAIALEVSEGQNVVAGTTAHLYPYGIGEGHK